jgi:Putative 2OG-Fe(II) oxygenase
VINLKNNPSPPRYEIRGCPECGTLNAGLRARVERLAEHEILRRNHFLGGRYENLYVGLEALPEMRMILAAAAVAAGRILARPQEQLRIGWWLNIMRPGDVTYPHTHDDGNELLSGAYYIDVPGQSGNLVLIDGMRRLEIQSTAGQFVFFAPDTPHEVTRNNSDRPRISVGLNVGPMELP